MFSPESINEEIIQDLRKALKYCYVSKDDGPV